MKKAVKIIVNVFAWIFLLFALLVTIVVFSAERNNGVPNVMGYMPMTVESDSMSPTFNKGDLVLVKEIDDLNNLEEGDVITFWTRIEGQRAKNTHRIVKVNKDEKGNVIDFTTRGDNNKGIDDELPASPNDIVGKWTGTKLNGVGKALDFLRTKKVPIAKLAKGAEVERKSLERHRRYLVAFLLICTNGYEIMRGHIMQVLKGGEG